MDSRVFKMSIPAIEEFSSLAGNAVAASCAVYGISMDMIDDIRIASTEAIYSLRHQAGKSEYIDILCYRECCGIIVEFMSSSSYIEPNSQKGDDEITKGVLETLIPKVNILSDDRGIFCITFLIPKPGDC